MPPRIHPDRALTNREKQARRYARVRDARAYVAAVEDLLLDAAAHMPQSWQLRHAPTIARARAARGTAATTTED